MQLPRLRWPFAPVTYPKPDVPAQGAILKLASIMPGFARQTTRKYLESWIVVNTSVSFSMIYLLGFITSNGAFTSPAVHYYTCMEARIATSTWQQHIKLADPLVYYFVL